MIIGAGSRIAGAVLIGTLAGLADVTGQLVDRLLEHSLIGLPTAFTIAISAAAFIFWIDGRFEQRSQQDAAANKERAIVDKAIAERLSRIEQRLDDLPCDDECYEHKRKKHS